MMKKAAFTGLLAACCGTALSQGTDFPIIDRGNAFAVPAINEAWRLSNDQVVGYSEADNTFQVLSYTEFAANYQFDEERIHWRDVRAPNNIQMRRMAAPRYVWGLQVESVPGSAADTDDRSQTLTVSTQTRPEYAVDHGAINGCDRWSESAGNAVQDINPHTPNPGPSLDGSGNPPFAMAFPDGAGAWSRSEETSAKSALGNAEDGDPCAFVNLFPPGYPVVGAGQWGAADEVTPSPGIGFQAFTLVDRLERVATPTLASQMCGPGTTLRQYDWSMSLDLMFSLQHENHAEILDLTGAAPTAGGSGPWSFEALGFPPAKRLTGYVCQPTGAASPANVSASIGLAYRLGAVQNLRAPDGRFLNVLAAEAQELARSHPSWDTLDWPGTRDAALSPATLSSFHARVVEDRLQPAMSDIEGFVGYWASSAQADDRTYLTNVVTREMLRAMAFDGRILLNEAGEWIGFHLAAHDTDGSIPANLYVLGDASTTDAVDLAPWRGHAGEASELLSHAPIARMTNLIQFTAPNATPPHTAPGCEGISWIVDGLGFDLPPTNHGDHFSLCADERASKGTRRGCGEWVCLAENWYELNMQVEHHRPWCSGASEGAAVLDHGDPGRQTVSWGTRMTTDRRTLYQHTECEPGLDGFQPPQWSAPTLDDVKHSCPPQNIEWAGGNCSNNWEQAVPHGERFRLHHKTATGGYFSDGWADVRCENGAYQIDSSQCGIAILNLPLNLISDLLGHRCSAQTLYWPKHGQGSSGCSASVGMTAHNSTVHVIQEPSLDSADAPFVGYRGDASFRCELGEWVLLSGHCSVINAQPNGTAPDFAGAFN